MVDTADNSSMRLQWEGDPAVDLRARPNNLSVLPSSYASASPGSVMLERILHSRLPIALVIRQEDPAWNGFDGGVLPNPPGAVLRHIRPTRPSGLIVLPTAARKRALCLGVAKCSSAAGSHWMYLAATEVSGRTARLPRMRAGRGIFSAVSSGGVSDGLVFDGVRRVAGVPRLYLMALEALRKFHLSTLEDLERVQPPSPAASVSASSMGCNELLGRETRSKPGAAASDRVVRGGTAAAAALESAHEQAPPVMVQFASSSRDNILILQPSNRSMSTQSLAELSFLERGTEREGTGPLWQAQQDGVRSSPLVLSETAGAASSGAGTLASMWTELAAGERWGGSMDRAHTSHISRRQSRSPFQTGQRPPGSSGAGSSMTSPLRAQGRAAGSGVVASSSTWHGGVAFEDGGTAQGHFRFFSTPGGIGGDAVPSTSSTAASMPSNHLPADFLSDALDGAETESDMELHWAMYSAQMESTRHSMKGAGAGGSGIGTASVSDVEADAAPSETEAVPLLSRMVASVDRAAHRVPHMFSPAPVLHSLRGALRAGEDNGSMHSSRSSVAVLERSGRQKSLASTLGSMDHDRRCPICMDGPTTVQVSGCKHGMCVACARTLCTSVSRAPACPLCRKTVVTFERVDTPGLM